MKAESKSFKSVEDDYLFFEQCVDEIERTLELWRPWLAELSSRGKPLRVLDFGCGRGSFTLQAMEALALPKVETFILLLEPVAEHAEEALRLLQARGYPHCEIVASLEAVPSSSIDLVLSHHVFYYVPDLAQVLHQLNRCLDQKGLFLCAVSGEKSGAGCLQEAAFSTAGLASPYRSGVEVCQVFVQEFRECFVEPYEVRIEMNDTTENRESLMRFLVGEYLDKVDWQRCLSLLNAYSDGTVVTIPSTELSLRYRKDGLKTHTLE